MDNINQRFPNLGEVTIAVLEAKLESVLGKTAIEKLRNPYEKKKLRDELTKIADATEKRIIAKYPDIGSVLRDLSIADISPIKNAVINFYENPTSSDTVKEIEKQIQILLPRNYPHIEIINAAIDYFRYLNEEMTSDSDFRDRMGNVSEQRTAQNTAELLEVFKEFRDFYKELHTEKIAAEITQAQINEAQVQLQEESQGQLTDEQKYIAACEGESLFEEFCQDVLKVNDFQKSTVRLLQEGEVDKVTVNRILDRLCKVFNRDHLRFLFQLSCLLYDHLPVDDELFYKIYKAGLSDSEINNLSANTPKNVSKRLARLFFKAFEKEEIKPIEFNTVLYKPNFAKYCANIETESTKDILIKWGDKSWFQGALVADSVDCIVLLYDSADSDFAKNIFRGVLKRWVDNGVLEQHIKTKDSTWKEIYRLLSW